MPIFSVSRYRAFVEGTLEAAGLTPGEASVCTDASQFADLHGTDTHGIVYILPRTLDSLKQGMTVAGAEPAIVQDQGASILLKGSGSPGPVMGQRATELAIERATQFGIAAVNTYNGNPLGLMGYYPALALQHGMIGLAMANTPPSVAPWGATSRVFGTNPFAYAAPNGDGTGILFDIATSAAAAGKLERAKRRGEPIPDDWVINANGEAVIDPMLAGAGAMLPFGGHKGSGFSLLVHLLTGALAGSTVGGEPTYGYADPERRGQSALFLVINPNGFSSQSSFAEHVDRQLDYIHKAQPRPGVDRVLVPGERGWQEAERREREGIPVAAEDWTAVLAAVAAHGLPVDRLIEQFGPDLAS